MVVDLLLAQAATDDEWHNAIDLYQIVGLSAVMKYIDGLPSVRQYFQTAGTVATAAVIPTQIKTKTTAVLVKA